LSRKGKRRRTRDGIRLIQDVDLTTTGGYAQAKAESLAKDIFRFDTKLKTIASHRKEWGRGNLAQGVTPYAITWDNEKKRWGVNEEEAAIVREIFELYSSGYSAQQIADMLTQRGAPPPPRNRKRRRKDVLGRERWWPTFVARVLRSDAYRGALAAYGGQFVVHHPSVDVSGFGAVGAPRSDFPVIINDELWRKVQRARGRRMKKQLTPRTLGHAWTSRIVCGECGLRFQGRMYRHKPSKHDGERRFGCLGTGALALRQGLLTEPCGNSRKLWESELEKEVRGALWFDLGEDDDTAIAGRIAKLVDNWLVEIDAWIAERDTEISPLLTDRKKLEERRRRLARTYADGLIDDGEYERELKEINRANEVLLTNVVGSEDELEELRDLRNSSERYALMARGLKLMARGQYPKLTDDQKALVGSSFDLVRGLHLEPDGDIERLAKVLDLKVIVYPDRVEARGILPLENSNSETPSRDWMTKRSPGRRSGYRSSRLRGTTIPYTCARSLSSSDTPVRPREALPAGQDRQ
jgi:hypothetical protein